jgi:hypothetical protein
MIDSFGEPSRPLASVDEERFVTPVEYNEPASSVDDREPRRLQQKSLPSPFKKDPYGYRWLRGIVTRDPKSGLWRITYAREPLDDDPYQGIMTLAADDSLPADESLDKLKNGDVILVEGDIDDGQLDRFKKPIYLVSHMQGPLKPKAE